ncbi:uncharacterized protein BP01DRAFT_155858 [Aspergillus saccharolyticus JOP 1030-1]|uniref:Uncharacterized protein n=1 Tax=Aspergillus saccharolyticus JOP 1030-1 TaxID=1450539 RepID=A0A318Z3R2_9EURO|nr:hypothetical protein BP01DRAFT_155858 [Aspergillus saccharolyticus JOP 1030-1]PYH41935.1 hypothetical protein BP01DRAFT_155858 [Aspergillus saccharolyticus JOP 1030-1]
MARSAQLWGICSVSVCFSLYGVSFSLSLCVCVCVPFRQHHPTGQTVQSYRDIGCRKSADMDARIFLSLSRLVAFTAEGKSFTEAGRNPCRPSHRRPSPDRPWQVST